MRVPTIQCSLCSLSSYSTDYGHIDHTLILFSECISTGLSNVHTLCRQNNLCGYRTSLHFGRRQKSCCRNKRRTTPRGQCWALQLRATYLLINLALLNGLSVWCRNQHICFNICACEAWCATVTTSKLASVNLLADHRQPKIVLLDCFIE